MIENAPTKTADAVRIFRTSLGLSQSTLAGRAKLTTATICRIERGQNQPTLTSLNKIADALGVEVAELVRGADE
jgi:putative transcriptional regulator